MYWLFLLLALGGFMLALSTTKMWLLVLSLVASLVFLLLWVKGLYAARISGVISDSPRALHPAELQALRDQFKPKGAEDAAPTPAPAVRAPAAPTAPVAPAANPFITPAPPQDPNQP